jgi:hypothetical protein
MTKNFKYVTNLCLNLIKANKVVTATIPPARNDPTTQPISVPTLKPSRSGIIADTLFVQQP